jgi:hypothetical protein
MLAAAKTRKSSSPESSHRWWKEKQKMVINLFVKSREAKISFIDVIEQSSLLLQLLLLPTNLSKPFMEQFQS